MEERERTPSGNTMHHRHLAGHGLQPRTTTHPLPVKSTPNSRRSQQVNMLRPGVGPALGSSARCWTQYVHACMATCSPQG